MKHLCCSKYIWSLLLMGSALFGGINDKSAIIYYGDKISYPMVGIHDYIIVQPALTNVHTHGFDVYKDKMYAYVSIGEVDKNIKEYAKVKKSWIVAQNKAWGSDVLDLTNPEYQEFFFKEMIEPQMKRGFKNFFFDTLDSYQLAKQNASQRAKSKEALAYMINSFHKRYPDSKLVINRGFEIIDKVYKSVEAVLFESYYRGLGGSELSYKKMSDSDREWLDIHINKIKSHKLDVICVDYLDPKDMHLAKKIIKKIKAKGMIPYISDKDLTNYGKSSKNAIKREILTLITESEHDRILLGAHQYGALPLEYMGYIEVLRDLNKEGLPKLKDMSQYAGVIVWLSVYKKNNDYLFEWVKKLQNIDIKVVFAGNFGLYTQGALSDLGILEPDYEKFSDDNKVLIKDKMMAYEIEPSLSQITEFYKAPTAKALLSIKDKDDQETTLAAITSWGGYAIDNAFMSEIGDDNLWVINPFEFFVQALRLKPIPVPDVTTQNGNRVLFSHVDGDGIMNRVEWNPKLYSGDVILDEILKKYEIPLSISVIGSEIDNNGLFPEIAPQLQAIVKKMYKVSNVEPATHTFTHPFFWKKILHDNLDEKYRLKPKGYKFSLDREIRGSLEDINKKYTPKGKEPKAQTVFWSGDCAPTETVLDNVYKNNILNINGGDTYISNSQPWLSYVAPLGLQRGEYYQIYTGAQNENVYTHNWLGPYWGFKKVVQTFKLTNSPRRLKPIDIYYHLYSGSKKAALNALKYVYDWSIKQDVFPIYTSAYIPKVMDYYTASMAEEKETFLINGMHNLKTVRVEKKNIGLDFEASKNIIGFNHFENHTYYHVGEKRSVQLKTSSLKTSENRPYLVSSNAKVRVNKFSKEKMRLNFEGYVPLKIDFHLPSNCSLKANPRVKTENLKNSVVRINYKKVKEAKIDVRCKL